MLRIVVAPVDEFRGVDRFDLFDFVKARVEVSHQRLGGLKSFKLHSSSLGQAANHAIFNYKVGEVFRASVEGQQSAKEFHEIAVGHVRRVLKKGKREAGAVIGVDAMKNP